MQAAGKLWFDAESLERTRRWAIATLYGVDLGERRTAPQPSGEGFDPIRPPLREDLDRTVLRIADPAGQTETLSFLARGPAESHALHPPPNEGGESGFASSGGSSSGETAAFPLEEIALTHFGRRAP
jgi:hypothetical protein